jgi:YD repeat-containing protein
LGTDARARRLAGDVAMAWYATKFEDHDGNSMSVVYDAYGFSVARFRTARPEIEENRPAAIYYTARENEGASRMVLFKYDDTKKFTIPRRFVGTAATNISAPLTRIETYVEGRLIRGYELVQAYSGADWLLNCIRPANRVLDAAARVARGSAL